MNRRSSQSDDGATAVEYALMLALIFLAVIAAATVLGTELKELFDFAAGKFT